MNSRKSIFNFPVHLQHFNNIGFTTGQEQPVKDALADDPLMKQILDATSAIALLAIKKSLANTPLTEVDRRIYYDAIEAKCRADFGYYDVENAARKEQEAAKPNLGFTVQNATVTVATDSVKLAVLTDSAGETKDVCLSRAVPILDSTQKPSGWYRQPVSRVDSINGNNRLYPRNVYQPALDQLKATGFPYAGEHPHPRSYKGADGRVLFDSSVPNQAVVFRDASIDENGVVWAEYKPLTTDMGKQVQAMLDAGLPIGFSNRMSGDIVTAKVQGKNVGVAKRLNLYTWDVVLNPAEPEAFTAPESLTDAAVSVILDSISKEEPNVNFLTMSLSQLKAWKAANPGHADMALCDQAIELKEKAENATAMTDELEKLRREKAEREQREEAERKKQAAQQALADAVSALPYDQKVKDGLIQKGAVITDAAEVDSFVQRERAFVDSLVIGKRLSALGVPQAGRATVIDPEVQVGAEGQPWKPIVDNLQAAMDDVIRSKTGAIPDPELRKANRAIMDRALKQMERENNQEFKKYMQSLTDSAEAINNGAIMDSAVSTTGDFAQAAIISNALMMQSWQDLNFLQLVMAEGFAGTTYKIPVEILSTDLYSQDDLIVGELDGIPTEGATTSLLEFGAEWIKRGTVVTKEAMVEMQSGPFRYDVLARNLANLPMRFQRYLDQRFSLEMLHVADEYQAKVVTNEAVAATEIEAANGSNVPAGSNAAFVVKLLCGQTAGAYNQKLVPTIVLPRIRQSIDAAGQRQYTIANNIVAKKGATTLTRGTWDPVTGQIKNGDYAVDFEKGKVYFTAASGVDGTNRPTISYSYATNISFFDLAVPNGVEPSKYFNRLLERFDYEKAYMGSAPRYVTPDFAIGSLNAMVNLKISELFYKWASPEGTRLLQGRMWFAERNGLNLGEINAPWAAGDSRILLGKINATRFGVGSPMQIEGPEPYYDANGKLTSAKQYYATEQISIATPLVTDKNGIVYNPPYRTIKFV
ncbi:hypothetical protein [Brevibacillus sp. HD3.3A]|uniref:hypothetical protein n=1 Tax=Brevibacillus sp. HD3.3A TaxID=2738979 RepID=UPI001E338FE7|nr:hypothetical protein [Brevibacillus sp. HD3.3A]UED72148.1 hypothetical protein HP435_29015 [Brevibacillus sp. HD3.3A]